MKRIAKFQKVSYEQFTEGWIDTFGATNAEEIKTIYDISNFQSVLFQDRQDMISMHR